MEILRTRIHERFPNGLTAVLATGGSRTWYILKHQQHHDNPGHIENLDEFMDVAHRANCHFIQMYLDCGGSHAIVPLFSPFQTNMRTEKYLEATWRNVCLLIDDETQKFYRDNDIHPYFAGLDTLLRLPHRHVLSQMATKLMQFQHNWVGGTNNLIWEFAPVPLYTLWQTIRNLSDAEHHKIEIDIETFGTDLAAIHQLLYKRFAPVAYGTDFQSPHLYIGTNRNRDLKLRIHWPLSLDMTEGTRLYFTPYPSFFMTQDGMASVLEDVLSTKTFRSANTDYRGMISRQQAQGMYERFTRLASDKSNITGLVKHHE